MWSPGAASCFPERWRPGWLPGAPGTHPSAPTGPMAVTQGPLPEAASAPPRGSGHSTHQQAQGLRHLRGYLLIRECRAGAVGRGRQSRARSSLVRALLGGWTARPAQRTWAEGCCSPEFWNLLPRLPRGARPARSECSLWVRNTVLGIGLGSRPELGSRVRLVTRPSSGVPSRTSGPHMPKTGLGRVGTPARCVLRRPLPTHLCQDHRLFTGTSGGGKRTVGGAQDAAAPPVPVTASQAPPQGTDSHQVVFLPLWGLNLTPRSP